MSNVLEPFEGGAYITGATLSTIIHSLYCTAHSFQQFCLWGTVDTGMKISDAGHHSAIHTAVVVGFGPIHQRPPAPLCVLGDLHLRRGCQHKLGLREMQLLMDQYGSVVDRRRTAAHSPTTTTSPSSSSNVVSSTSPHGSPLPSSSSLSPSFFDHTVSTTTAACSSSASYRHLLFLVTDDAHNHSDVGTLTLHYTLFQSSPHMPIALKLHVDNLIDSSKEFEALRIAVMRNPTVEHHHQQQQQQQQNAKDEHDNHPSLVEQLWDERLRRLEAVVNKQNALQCRLHELQQKVGSS